MEKPPPESFKLLTISAEKLQASMGRQASISTYATERARLLLGCYRTGEANDPETYVAAIAATLARYSETIITEVTHPVSGLPGRIEWLPKIKEVREACEERAEFVANQVAREKRIAEQMAARAEQDRQDRLRELAAVRPTIEALKAKYGDNWGLKEPPRKPPEPAPSWEKVTADMRADPSRLQRLLNTDRQKERDAYKIQIEAERAQAKEEWNTYTDEGS
jgi:hypothetical protein